MPRGRSPRTALVVLGAALVLLSAGAPVHAQAPESGPGGDQAGDPGGDHDLRLPAQDAAVAGEHRALSLTIAPRPGHTISRDGPIAIELRTGADSGVQLPRHRYQRRDAADPHADAPRFDLHYRAQTPGRHLVTVDVRFWVCARRTCRPVRATREVTIEVAPAPSALRDTTRP